MTEVKSFCECGARRELFNGMWICYDCEHRRLDEEIKFHLDRARFYEKWSKRALILLMSWTAGWLLINVIEFS